MQYCLKYFCLFSLVLFIYIGKFPHWGTNKCWSYFILSKKSAFAQTLEQEWWPGSIPRPLSVLEIVCQKRNNAVCHRLNCRLTSHQETCSLHVLRTCDAIGIRLDRSMSSWLMPFQTHMWTQPDQWNSSFSKISFDSEKVLRPHYWEIH